MWVHCPRCEGPARDTRTRLICVACGYNHGAKESRPRRGDKLTLEKWSPACPNERCGAPISREGRFARMNEDGKPLARVKCTACGREGLHPALVGSSTLVMARPFPRRRAPYLTREIDGETLWVANSEHLAMLRTWLGATLRERGPVAGLTMMARLPRWMKAASKRERVVAALDDIAAQMAREGLD